MRHEERHRSNGRPDRKTVLLGLGSLLWLLFRTGTKPSRIVYPCQKAAAANVTTMLSLTVVPLFVTVPRKAYRLLASRKAKAVFLVFLASLSIPLWMDMLPAFGLPQPPFSPKQLVLNPHSATESPASDIFIVNNRPGTDSGITELVNVMGTCGLPFYKSSTTEPNQGPNGLIAKDDVVLIKVSWQWINRGRTNSDLLKGLIQKILNHPDGFIGEIVVADNGQGQVTSGPEPYPGENYNNAEVKSFSIQDVVDSFLSSYDVSTYVWDSIRAIGAPTGVNEYSDGDMRDGYVVNQTENLRTGIKVSYPKFRTSHGTYISFKHGIWNTSTSSYNSDRLKVINIATLKSHIAHGVTTSVKHYMGVVSESAWNQGGLTASHVTVKDGGMGTLMVETRFPTLNIIDAIYVNANPELPSGNPYVGPQTDYNVATKVNVVMASLDPVALDYWAAKYVLKQTATLNGYTDVRSIDPDYPSKVGRYQEEAFGVWLNKSRDEIVFGGKQATTDEDHMNVYLAGEAPPAQLTVNSVIVRSTSSPEQVSSTDPWTWYYANASITTTSTFANLINVTWVFNSTNVMEDAPDSVQSHYTFKWTPGAGFSEWTMTGHLNSTASLSPPTSASSGWFRLAFRFGKSASKTYWICRVTAYLGTVSNSKKSSSWTMNTYIGLSLSSDRVDWTVTSLPVNNQSANSPLNMTVSSNVPVKIQVKGDGPITNGTNIIPLSNVYIGQTSDPTNNDGVRLTTDYQDWETSISPSEGSIHPSYWFITIPEGTTNGTYRFTFYIKVVEDTSR